MLGIRETTWDARDQAWIGQILLFQCAIVLALSDLFITASVDWTFLLQIPKHISVSVVP